MKKILAYVTPLSVLSFLAFLLGITFWFIPSEQRIGRLVGLILLFIVSLPTLIVNGIINSVVIEKRKRIRYQVIIAIIILVLTCYFMNGFSI